MKYSALTGSILAMVLAAVYVNLGWWMQQEGFFSSEALFYVAKADMFYSGIVPRLAVFGVTFPLLPFQAVLVLFPLTGLFTPVVASALGMAFLFRFLWSVAEKTRDGMGLEAGFTCNISGQSRIFICRHVWSKHLPAAHLFSVAFCTTCLPIWMSLLPFSIAMAGVFYTGIIFVQFSYVWIFVFILPVLLLISLRGVEVESVRNQLTLEILFDDSYRRNLFVRKVLATSFSFTDSARWRTGIVYVLQSPFCRLQYVLPEQCLGKCGAYLKPLH